MSYLDTSSFNRCPHRHWQRIRDGRIMRPVVNWDNYLDPRWCPIDREGFKCVECGVYVELVRPECREGKS
jgi:hypothetical protein